MKYSLFFTFVFATCHASNIGLGGIFPRSNPPEEPPIVAQETIVENPEFEPTTTDLISTTTMVYPPSQTTIDPYGTIIYYCIPSPEETTPQETWPAKTTVVDAKTIYYCPPKTTDVIINEVSSTIYYSLPTTTEKPVEILQTTTNVHVCEVTSVIDVKTASTCEVSVETLKMDVFKTIYVSSCVVTDEVVVIEEIPTTTTTTTTKPVYVLPTY